MQERKYQELEDRASVSSQLDEIKRLEARVRVHQEIELMKQEGKALVLTEEEEKMLGAFRRFRLRMRKHGAREVGFVLLVFPYGSNDGRCNYISNGADRKDMVKLLREQANRFDTETI